MACERRSTDVDGYWRSPQHRQSRGIVFRREASLQVFCSTTRSRGGSFCCSSYLPLRKVWKCATCEIRRRMVSWVKKKITQTVYEDGTGPCLAKIQVTGRQRSERMKRCIHETGLEDMLEASRIPRAREAKIHEKEDKAFLGGSEGGRQRLLDGWRGEKLTRATERSDVRDKGWRR
ncbi:hypothetical protein GWK47_052231 [Chionoecetes opilio]|uniref:Uncharacterized protein n=1 Tax=Chionoecetes opilio TaxID=41210 RepID=A0A8J4Y0A7_CHIOP|nr:hypothetical protein GWK47_052231 [Chionoecetes opilio]